MAWQGAMMGCDNRRQKEAYKEGGTCIPRYVCSFILVCLALTCALLSCCPSPRNLRRPVYWTLACLGRLVWLALLSFVLAGRRAVNDGIAHLARSVGVVDPPGRVGRVGRGSRQGLCRHVAAMYWRAAHGVERPRPVRRVRRADLWRPWQRTVTI